MGFYRELSDGNTGAFTENYNAFYPLVFSSLYRRLGDFHEAEDICQEVFIRYYRKIGEVENPRRWLLGALRIVVADYYREKGRKDIDADRLFDDVGAGYVNGFRDARLVITDALEEMRGNSAEHDAELFDLVAVHGFTLLAAARHLAMTHKQARYRYGRAVQRFTAALDKRGIKSLEELL